MTHVQLDYYNTMMYYVGMLEYHFENSYIAKIEDFCDAYPEDVDVFGIARDLVFFLQVKFLAGRRKKT